jgi:hypothetical protein
MKTNLVRIPAAVAALMGVSDATFADGTDAEIAPSWVEVTPQQVKEFEDQVTAELHRQGYDAEFKVEMPSEDAMKAMDFDKRGVDAGVAFLEFYGPLTEDGEMTEGSQEGDGEVR